MAALVSNGHRPVHYIRITRLNITAPTTHTIRNTHLHLENETDQMKVPSTRENFPVKYRFFSSILLSFKVSYFTHKYKEEGSSIDIIHHPILLLF